MICRYPQCAAPTDSGDDPFCPPHEAQWRASPEFTQRAWGMVLAGDENSGPKWLAARMDFVNRSAAEARSPEELKKQKDSGGPVK